MYVAIHVVIHVAIHLAIHVACSYAGRADTYGCSRVACQRLVKTEVGRPPQMCHARTLRVTPGPRLSRTSSKYQKEALLRLGCRRAVTTAVFTGFDA